MKNCELQNFFYETATPEERSEVIAELHSKLFVHMDHGHYVKEKDHKPWYIAAKANMVKAFDEKNAGAKSSGKKKK